MADLSEVQWFVLVLQPEPANLLQIAEDVSLTQQRFFARDACTVAARS